MEYVAKHYIKVDGQMRFPGEFFRKDYDEQAEKRLIEAGAIQKADAPVSYAAEAAPVIPEDVEPAQDAEDNGGNTQEAEEEAPDMEMPTVDVEDAVVTAPKTEEKTNKRGGRRK